MNTTTFSAHGRRFIDCVVDARLDEAAELLKAHPELGSSRNSTGETPLHWLAIENEPAGVQLLLNEGAAADTSDRHDSTPLYDAAGLGLVDVCRLLLQHGADARRRCTFMRDTPLHQAARHTPNADVIDLLIDHGAELGACDKNGQIPLHQAVFMSNVGAIERFVDRGTPLNTEDEFGDTPLGAALVSVDIRGVQYLLGAGARYKRNGSAAVEEFVSLLREKGRDDIASLLVSLGGEADAGNC